MAIQPIATQQSQTRNLSALDSILSRGGSSFDTAIAGAVQIGRDLANKQSLQERNFQTEQKRQVNLTQRRAENLQQDMEDLRTHDEGQRRFDTSFGESQRQFGLSRQDTLDNRTEQTRQFGLDFGLRKEKADQEAIEFPKRMAVMDKRTEASLRNADVNFKAAEIRLATAETARDNARTKVEVDKANKAAKEALQIGQRGLIETFNAALDAGDTDAANNIYNRGISNPQWGFPQDFIDEAAVRVGRPNRSSRVIDGREDQVQLETARNTVASLEAEKKLAESGDRAAFSAGEQKRLDEAKARLTIAEQNGSLPSAPTSAAASARKALGETEDK
tara:strand:- start:3098 stop:4096 length:999 start_codon:yes stop_codon:yes gene_type:complete